MNTPSKNTSGGLKFSPDASQSLHKAAVALGSKGGKQSSPAKTAAVTKNAQLPRK